MWQIQNGLDFENAQEMFHFARIPWVDRGYSDISAEEMPSPRCFKSHAPIKFYAPDFNKIAKVCFTLILNIVPILSCIFMSIKILLIKNCN